MIVEEGGELKRKPLAGRWMRQVNWVNNKLPIHQYMNEIWDRLDSELTNLFRQAGKFLKPFASPCRIL